MRRQWKWAQVAVLLVSMLHGSLAAAGPTGVGSNRPSATEPSNGGRSPSLRKRKSTVNLAPSRSKKTRDEDSPNDPMDVDPPNPKDKDKDKTDPNKSDDRPKDDDKKKSDDPNKKEPPPCKDEGTGSGDPPSNGSDKGKSSTTHNLTGKLVTSDGRELEFEVASGKRGKLVVKDARNGKKVFVADKGFHDRLYFHGMKEDLQHQIGKDPDFLRTGYKGEKGPLKEFRDKEKRDKDANDPKKPREDGRPTMSEFCAGARGGGKDDRSDADVVESRKAFCKAAADWYREHTKAKENATGLEKDKALYVEQKRKQGSPWSDDDRQDGAPKASDELEAAFDALPDADLAVFNPQAGYVVGRDIRWVDTEKKLITALKAIEHREKGKTSQELRKDGKSMLSGATLTLNGDKAPCASCENAMTKLARNYGATVRYNFHAACANSDARCFAPELKNALQEKAEDGKTVDPARSRFDGTVTFTPTGREGPFVKDVTSMCYVGSKKKG